MWLFRILAVSWLCVLWTKVNLALTEDALASKNIGSTVPSTTGDQNAGDFGFGNVETTKAYTADSTVRSFFPIRGKQKWIRRGYPPAEEMLFFNVSVVNDNEEVSLAELHLHRRRIAKIHGSYHKRFLPLPYRVVLYQVQPNYKYKQIRDARTMKLASLPVSHMTKSGWHRLDVTAVLRELLINAQGPAELLLGVQFEAPRGVMTKSYSPLVPIKHFLKPVENVEIGHPYKASSYLVVFSEVDPYFEEFEDGIEDSDETDNDIPDSHVFRERHFKHKIFKVTSNEVPNVSDKVMEKESKEKNKKYKAMENEVYKTDYSHKGEDVVRHKSKHRVNEVKRSKADELALQQKNKLKSLPFLHTNEVEEIRQTSRRLTRSLNSRNGTHSASGNEIPGMPGYAPRSKDIRKILNNLIKEVASSQSWNETTEGECVNRPLTIRTSDVDLGVKVASPSSFVTTFCSGPCYSVETIPFTVRRSCQPGSRRVMDFEYYDRVGNIVYMQLENFLVTDCVCR